MSPLSSPKDIIHHQCEALVVGGGIAGCWTALKLVERGIDTLLIFYNNDDRGGKLGSTHLSVGAVSTAPIDRPDYTGWLDELARGQVQSTVAQITVEYLAEEIEVLKKFDALKKIELGIALASGSGRKLIETLLIYLREQGVRIIDNAWVVKIDADENSCRGIQYQAGNQLGVISAASMVLANGGYSGLYHGAVKTGTYGSVHARFLEAGGKLSNLEFVFKHGYGQPDLGKLTPTEELPGVELYDNDAVRVLWLEEELFYGRGTHNHFQAFMTWRKDENRKYFVDFRFCNFHRSIKSLQKQGLPKTDSEIESALSKFHDYVAEDHVGAFRAWFTDLCHGTMEYTFDEFNKIKSLISDRCPVDKHRIRQIAYFSMGGIMHHGFLTNLKHVFVNGESMHDYGAHRVGGLPWALYLCAARKIADDISTLKSRQELCNLSVEPIDYLGQFSRDMLEAIQLKLYDFVERGRDESSLSELLDWLHNERAALRQANQTFDDSYAYLLLAESIVRSSMARKESRGCFFRADYAREDFRLSRMRTVASYDPLTDAITVDCVDKANILDLVLNRSGELENIHSASEKNNAAYFLLKKHLVAANSQAIAIEHDDLHLSYEQLNELVDQYAFFLFSQGLTKGDRVALHLRDGHAWVALFLACMQLGLIAIPINTFAKENDILYFLHDSQAKLLLSEKALLSSLNFSILSQRNATRIISIEDLFPLQDQKISGCAPVDKHSLAMILYTSGSTGKPKGAMHSHADIEFTAESFGREQLKPENGDRFYSNSRLFFAYGFGNSLTFPLYFGCTSVLTSNKLTPDETLALLSDKRITHFFSIPAIYSVLVKQIQLSSLTSLPLKVSVSAGEPLAASIGKDWVGLTQRRLIDGLGSTEALHIFCTNTYSADGRVELGREVTGYKLHLLDDNNFAFYKHNVPGNLALSGGSIARGYWNNPEASKSAYINNLLITGDRFVINDEGNFVYLGRTGDTYKVSGLWVSAVEIESVLKTIANIDDAAVVCYLNEQGFQQSTAFIVPKDKSTLTADHLGKQNFHHDFQRHVLQHLEAQLSKYKIPNSVYITAELPRTATGKVAKATLKEMALNLSLREPHKPASVESKNISSINTEVV